MRFTLEEKDVRFSRIISKRVGRSTARMFLRYMAKASRKKHQIIVYGYQYVDWVDKPYDDFDWYFKVLNPAGEEIYDSRTDQEVLVLHREHEQIDMYKRAEEWALSHI